MDYFNMSLRASTLFSMSLTIKCPFITEYRDFLVLGSILLTHILYKISFKALWVASPLRVDLDLWEKSFKQKVLEKSKKSVVMNTLYLLINSISTQINSQFKWKWKLRSAHRLSQVLIKWISTPKQLGNGVSNNNKNISYLLIISRRNSIQNYKEGRFDVIQKYQGFQNYVKFFRNS